MIKPQTYEEAMLSIEAPHWKVAWAEELLSLEKTGVYDEVDQQKGWKIINCK